MSETETMPELAPCPPDIAPETKTTLRNTMKAAGWSDEVLDGKGYGNTPYVAPAPTVDADQTHTQVMQGGPVYMRNDGLGHEDAVKAARHLIATGTDKATVLAAAAAQGISAAEIEFVAPDPNADAETRKQFALDGEYAVPASAADYHLRYDDDFARSSSIEDLAAINKDFTEGFRAAGVPAKMAQPLLDAIMANGVKYSDMSDAAREIAFAEQGALFRTTSANFGEDFALSVSP